MRPVAFVTGGTRGIGRAIVEGLHACNFRVVFFGRGKENGTSLEAALGEDRCRFVAADFSSEAAAMDVFAQAMEEEGRIDLLVNNMGTGEPGGAAVRDYEGADVARVLTVNLHVPIQLSRLAWQFMHQQNQGRGVTEAAAHHDSEQEEATGSSSSGSNTTSSSHAGVIVNVSSVGSSFSADHAQHIPIYSCAKAGLDQFTRAIAVPALEQDGVRVYTLNPGVVDTDMGRGVVNSRFPFDNVHDFAAAYNVGGEPASARDVAQVVVDLAQGRTHGFSPGDAIACYARGTLVNMSALSSSMHLSSLKHPGNGPRQQARGQAEEEKVQSRLQGAQPRQLAEQHLARGADRAP